MGFVGNLGSLISNIRSNICRLRTHRLILFQSCCFDGLYSNSSPLKATSSDSSFSGFHFHLRCQCVQKKSSMRLSFIRKRAKTRFPFCFKDCTFRRSWLALFPLTASCSTSSWAKDFIPPEDRRLVRGGGHGSYIIILLCEKCIRYTQDVDKEAYILVYI